MSTLIWIAVIVAAYFILKQFDTKNEKKTIEEVKKPSQTETPTPADDAEELKFFCIKDKGYHVSVWPKDVSQFDIIEFQIAGITHHREAALNHLGEAMGILVAEPNNPYDANAIRIMTPDWQCVGYVPQDRTDEISEHTKLPCPCLFYIGVRNENGEQIFYTDAYIRLDMLNPKQENN